MRYGGCIIGAIAILAFVNPVWAGMYEEKAQTMIGGAQSSITGWVSRVESDGMWIVDRGGDETRVGITDNTSMICKTRPEAKKPMAERKRAGGFRLGECPFEEGEAVRAEVASTGVAKMIRYIREIPESRTEALGLPRPRRHRPSAGPGKDLPHHESR